ncbi:hypothetical protein EDD11_009418 [Mortierella claussenii]|nr:hypothetical protein EDD11_009418 [Mortierella claussenii]
MVPLSSAVLVVEPCIAHIVIPQSHRELLRKTLENVPAPVWTIKKKSVRFKSAPMDAEESNSSSNAARREQACPVAYSTIKSKSSSSSDTSSSIKPGGSSSLSSSFLSSPTTSSAMCSNSVLALHSPSAVDKDPEEKMAELMELKQMKIRQGDFLHVKSQIFQIAQDLEDKNSILDEVRSERKALHSELSRYIGMVKQIQKDFAMAQEAEAQLIKERDQLSQHLTQLKQHDFKVLKEEVDLLRIRKGLRPLPSLEQEEAEFMGRYLEERRGQWREDGILQDGAGAEHSILANGGVGGSSGSHTAAVGSPYSVRSGSGHRPSSSSGSSPLYAAAASSSATTAISGASKSRSARVSASSSTSTLREKSKENRDGKGKGRDNSRGRERDRDRDRDMGSGERGRDKRRDDRWTQKTPTHSKDHNDGVKTSSAGTSGTGARRGRPSLSASIKTARQKNQSRSQSPPSAQTVSASESNDIARAERLKKRSRY